MNPNIPSSGRVDVLSREVVLAAALAQIDYEARNFKHKRTPEDSMDHCEAAMRAALEEIGVDKLIAAGNALDAAMDMQIKRESGDFHIDAQTAKHIWDEARKLWATALAALTEPQS